MTSKPATKKEKECIEHLKATFRPEEWLDPEDIGFLKERAYFRFARAREGNKEEATKMMKEALEWRKEYKPYLVTSDDVAEVMGETTMTLGGRCKAGCPIILMTLSTPNKCNVADRVKLLVYILEETELKGYDGLTWIVDFGEMGKHEADPRSTDTRKSTMHILQDFYPERLGRMLLFRSPWYVRFLITFVKPFLSASTRSKVISSGHKISHLEKYVAEDQIPARLGGKLEGRSAEILKDLPYASEACAEEAAQRSRDETIASQKNVFDGTNSVGESSASPEEVVIAAA